MHCTNSCRRVKKCSEAEWKLDSVVMVPEVSDLTPELKWSFFFTVDLSSTSFKALVVG